VGGVAVISLTRLYPAFYARNHDMESFRRRSAIEAVHEVGHLLGVHHCEDRHCVMFYSSTITDSDRKARSSAAVAAPSQLAPRACGGGVAATSATRGELTGQCPDSAAFFVPTK